MVKFGTTFISKIDPPIKADTEIDQYVCSFIGHEESSVAKKVLLEEYAHVVFLLECSALKIKLLEEIISSAKPI